MLHPNILYKAFVYDFEYRKFRFLQKIVYFYKIFYLKR